MNAFQSQSDVVLQKSIREGFGLTVAEALWKGRPTIGGNVGGIPLQIVDGEDGYLVVLARGGGQALIEILQDPELGRSARPRRQGAHARALPDPAPAARLAADLHRARRSEPAALAATTRRRACLIQRGGPLILTIVSNRGPAEFGHDEQGERIVQRGGGGLVTALTGLVSHREALWIASAMTEEDVEVAERERRPGDGRARRDLLRRPDGRLGPRGLRPLLQRDREPDPLVHPALPLGPLERAGHPRRPRWTPGSDGYKVVNNDIAEARARGDRRAGEPGRDAPRLPPLHLPGHDPAGAPRRVPPLLRPHPLVPAGRLADPPQPHGARRSTEGMLANDIIGFHTTAYCRNFLHCCRELMELEVDYERQRRDPRRPRDLGARLPALDRHQRLYRAAAVAGRCAATRRSSCAGAATS